MNYAICSYYSDIIAVAVGATVGTVNAIDPDDGARVQYTILRDTIQAQDRNGATVTVAGTPVDFMVGSRVHAC